MVNATGDTTPGGLNIISPGFSINMGPPRGHWKNNPGGSWCLRALVAEKDFLLRTKKWSDIKYFKNYN